MEEIITPCFPLRLQFRHKRTLAYFYAEHNKANLTLQLSNVHMLWSFLIPTLTQIHHREMISLSCERREEAQEIKLRQRERLGEKINMRRKWSQNESPTEHIRDRRYRRWDKNQFSTPHSSSWLVNHDWVCIPSAVALTPKGLNQTGGYFKLWWSLRTKSRLNPWLRQGNVSLSDRRGTSRFWLVLDSKRLFDAKSEAE